MKETAFRCVQKFEVARYFEVSKKCSVNSSLMKEMMLAYFSLRQKYFHEEDDKIMATN